MPFQRCSPDPSKLAPQFRYPLRSRPPHGDAFFALRGVEEPLHQLRSPDAERILEILTRSSTITIDGNREALDS